jgi:hypothetical protein
LASKFIVIDEEELKQAVNQIHVNCIFPTNPSLFVGLGSPTNPAMFFRAVAL